MDDVGAAVVTVTRGGIPESRHRVHIAVCDAAGRVLAAAGEPDLRAFLRSSAKPLQALPLVESGAADALGLGAQELAVACGSHLGMEMHAGTVAGLLARAGLSPEDLACGVDGPADASAAATLRREGRPPGRIHNNCSGKHAGMLACCRQMGWPTTGYMEPDHPLQRWILEIVTELAGTRPELGTDGCGVPTYALPLAAMATAYARLASGTALPPARAAAAQRLGTAMAAHPEMVAGPGNVGTAILAAAGARLLSKGGAEGVWCLARRGPGAGLGLALKVEDGANRAAPPAALAALAALGLDLRGDPRLAGLAHPRITNTLGAEVGDVQVRLPEGFGAGLQGILAPA